MRIALCWCRTTIYIGLYLTSKLCDSIYTRVWIWILYQPPLYWQQIAQCTPHLTELPEGHYQVTLEDDVMRKFGVLDPTIHFTTMITSFRILTWFFSCSMLDSLCCGCCDVLSLLPWTNVSNPRTPGYWRLVIIIRTRLSFKIVFHWTQMLRKV